MKGKDDLRGSVSVNSISKGPKGCCIVDTKSLHDVEQYSLRCAPRASHIKVN